MKMKIAMIQILLLFIVDFSQAIKCYSGFDDKMVSINCSILNKNITQCVNLRYDGNNLMVTFCSCNTFYDFSCWSQNEELL